MKLSQSIPALCCIALLNGSCITRPWKQDCHRYASTHKECRFETKGTISFEEKAGKVVANLRPRGGQQGGSVHWPDTAVPLRSIDTTRTYRLQYLGARIVVGVDQQDWNDTKLLKVIDGDRILYDASICPLHREAMERAVEEGVSYEDYYPYRKHYFEGNSPRLSPNDGKAYLLCGSGIRHMTWRCPTCHRISEAWKTKHGIN